jgi:hypothetical protein
MPGIKTTIYDGSVHVDGTDVLDLTGTINTLVNNANGYNAGTKVITVDGTSAATNFSAGDKVINGSTGKALGTIQTVDSSTQITLKNGSLTSLANNDPISKHVPFEIVAIQAINDCILTKLYPVNTKWPGTHTPAGATWAATGFEDFGAFDGLDGSVLADAIPAGATIEGRWKYVQAESGKSVVCYLKATPTQTF